ncbi:hypothetical protein HDU86_000186 [Geranomyces michiganensis]|nr:hypothetical protein HDU86_000186 [Geranomyces michiganensis]
MYTFGLVHDGDNHVLDVGTDGTGSIVVGRKTFGIADKRVSRQQIKLDYDSSNGQIWIQQLGPNASFIQPANQSHQQPIGKDARSELFHNDRFWLLEEIEPFDLKISPVPPIPTVGQKRSYEQKEDDDDLTADEQPSPSVAKTRARKPRAARKKKRRTDSASGSDEDSYYDPDDPSFVVDDDEDESAESDFGVDDNGSDEDDGPAKLQVCMFGKKCYRKNPVHFQEYAHPWLDDPAGPSNRPASTPGASRFAASPKPQASSKTEKSQLSAKAGGSTSPKVQSSTDTSRNTSPLTASHASSNAITARHTRNQVPSLDDQSPSPPSPSGNNVAVDSPARFKIPGSSGPALPGPSSKPFTSSLAASYAKAFPSQTPTQGGSDSNRQADDASERMRTKSVEPVALPLIPEPPALAEAQGTMAQKVSEGQGKTPSANNSSHPRTLAFPSLATREGQLDLSRAAAAFAEVSTVCFYHDAGRIIKTSI